MADAARQPSARGSSARCSQRSQHGIGKGGRPARESSDQPSRSGVTPPGWAVFACPLQERAEAHSGRAGGLARPAAQASVDVMGEGPVGRHATLDGEPHEVESSPGRVVLVAGRLVGRASREAEAAVHARGEIGSAIQQSHRARERRRHPADPSARLVESSSTEGASVSSSASGSDALWSCTIFQP